MSFSALQQTLDTFFKTNIADTVAGVRVAYDNQESKPKQTDVSGFVRHTVLHDDRNFSALGRRNIRANGNVGIQIFIPKGTGPKQANLIADAVDTAYSGNCIDNVQFFATEETLRQTIGDYYRINLLITFYADQIRS